MSEFSIVFAGTPEFAAQHLEALLGDGITVDAVYSQPDRPKGRGKKLQASPVKQLALAHNLPVYQPINFKNEEDVAALAALKPDLMIVVAYGLLLPENVLSIPRLGCINVHASLLPRWRGAAPIERAIEAGDSLTGVTIMQMDVGLDTGDMLLTVEQTIDSNSTGDSLREQLANIGSEALIQAVKKLQGDGLTANKQDNDLANYAHKLSKAEAAIDWQQSAEQIERKIRAFTSANVCFGLYQGERVRVWQAEVVNKTHQAKEGEILSISKQSITVACGEGTLNLKQIQLTNSRQMSVADVLNGRADYFKKGDCFE